MLTYLSAFLKQQMPWELLIQALKAGNQEFGREVLDCVVSRERGGWVQQMESFVGQLNLIEWFDSAD